MSQSDSPVICTQCKGINEIDHRFCADCGADLSAQKSSRQIRPNRLGCLGCLGLFALLIGLIGIGSFSYLKSRGIIYEIEGRTALTFVTITEAYIYQSPRDTFDKEKEPEAALYTPGDKPTLFATEVPIRLHLRYMAARFNDESRFIVKTYRRILPNRRQPSGELRLLPNGSSDPTPVIEIGTDGTATLVLHGGGKSHTPGDYVTQIFVGPTHSQEKLLVNYIIALKPEDSTR